MKSKEKRICGRGNSLAKIPEGERSLSCQLREEYVSGRGYRVQEKLGETGRLDFEGLLGNTRHNSKLFKVEKLFTGRTTKASA